MEMEYEEKRIFVKIDTFYHQNGDIDYLEFVITILGWVQSSLNVSTFIFCQLNLVDTYNWERERLREECMAEKEKWSE